MVVVIVVQAAATIGHFNQAAWARPPLLRLVLPSPEARAGAWWRRSRFGPWRGPWSWSARNLDLQRTS
jgi:hypothetical protein